MVGSSNYTISGGTEIESSQAQERLDFVSTFHKKYFVLRIFLMKNVLLTM